MGDNRGFVHFYNATLLTPTGEEALSTEIGVPIESLAFSNDGSKFIVGDTAGFVSIFQTKSRT